MISIRHRQETVPDGRIVRIVLFDSFVELPYLAMYSEPQHIDKEFKELLKLEDNEHLIAVKAYKRSWSKIHKSLRHERCHMKLRGKNPINDEWDAVCEELAVIKRTGLRVPAGDYLLALVEWLETERGLLFDDALTIVLSCALGSSLKRVRRKARQFIYLIEGNNEQHN